MLFHSPVFLFWFLPLALAAYALTPAHARNLLLILVSYIFYGWWNPLLLPLLIFSTVLNYVAGNIIHRSAGTSKKTALWIGIFINLGLLGFFKYEGMLAGTLAQLTGRALIPHLAIPLPLGISFFTFEGVSYLVDVYRGTTAPSKRLTDFACFMSFFPHLIAGPIIRYGEIAPQFHHAPFGWNERAEGIYRFLLGLSKKVLLADLLAVIADRAFAAESLSSAFAWTGLLAYSMQIYLDFSAYTDMAIGLGLLFGFRLPENFDNPYRAKSVTEFWQRWHMTLSRWIRDYVYIPLGGSRGSTLFTVRNLLITMMIAGLWHGASWTFVAWGAYYGILLGLERIARAGSFTLIPEMLKVPITFLLVTLGWVLFRSPDFTSALAYYQALFSGAGSAIAWWMPASVIAAYAFLFLEIRIPKLPRQFSPGLTGVMVVLMLASLFLVFGSTGSPFIYFQF